MNFNPAPTVGTTVNTPDGRSWKWNGQAWDLQARSQSPLVSLDQFVEVYARVIPGYITPALQPITYV